MKKTHLLSGCMFAWDQMWCSSYCHFKWHTESLNAAFSACFVPTKLLIVNCYLSEVFYNFITFFQNVQAVIVYMYVCKYIIYVCFDVVHNYKLFLKKKNLLKIFYSVKIYGRKTKKNKGSNYTIKLQSDPAKLGKCCLFHGTISGHEYLPIKSYTTRCTAEKMLLTKSCCGRQHRRWQRTDKSGILLVLAVLRALSTERADKKWRSAYKQYAGWAESFPDWQPLSTKNYARYKYAPFVEERTSKQLISCHAFFNIYLASLIEAILILMTAAQSVREKRGGGELCCWTYVTP